MKRIFSLRACGWISVSAGRAIEAKATRLRALAGDRPLTQHRQAAVENIIGSRTE
jgi:hypothetical protein